MRRALTSASLLAVELVVSLMMWAPIPLAWMWVGARVYEATGSIALDGAIVLLGFLVTITAAMKVLIHLDRAWIAVRRRAGHPQREGALTRVVVVSATVGLAAFLLWFYLLSQAFIMPFMPMH